MKLVRKLLLHLGIGHHPFDSEKWKKSLDKRKCFVKAILKDRIGIQMNQEELVTTFGHDRVVYLNKINSYKVSVLKKGIMTDGNTSSMLDFYLDDKGIVKDIKLRVIRTR